MNWRHRAACRRHDPEMFFPLSPTVTEQAKAICGGCPVLETCLAWALDTGQAFGVWGGLTEEERRLLLRARWAAARKTRRTA